MKRFVYMISLFLISFSFANSAYLKDVPQKLNQPDGTELNCFATGDEFFNWLHDASGYTIIQNTTNGWYVYANLINDEMVPTNLIAGRDNPSSIGLRPWLIYSEQKLRSFRSKFSIPKQFQRIDKKSEKLQAASNKGVLNNVAIFIRFADETSFKQNKTYFNTPYNATGQISVYDYYWNLSFNQLEIKTNFFPQPQNELILSYQDNYPRSYYKVYNAVSAPDGYKNDNERTIREMTLIKNAVDYVKASIPDNLDLDMDDDGYVDNVAFIVTGGPEGWADLIWPHMWALYYYNVQIHGQRVWNFNFLMADWFDSSVLCHEMFHTLGAPDLYRYYTSGSPVGYWDIMSNNMNPPQFSSMFMRWKYGKWIDNIPEVNKSGWYELNPSSMKYGSVIKVKSRYNPDEYFVLEYRKKEGRYDISLPKGGLLVWRINPNYDGNAGGPPDGVYVYRLNGTPSSWGTISEAPLAEENGRSKMNDYSTNPKPFLTNGETGGFNVSDVGKMGSTIRFRLNFPPQNPILIAPTNNNPATILTPYFDWNDTENADYYTFELSDKADFSNLVYSQTNMTVSELILPMELEFLQTYYWRVTAHSNYEEPAAISSTWLFNVTPEKPVITSISKPQILCKDEDFAIMINAEGRVMQFQWYRDGELIPGATKPLLTKSNIDFPYSGLFMCRVTNYPGWDTVYSDNIALYVITDTDFLIQPKDQVGYIGGSVDFTFRVHINGKEDRNYADIKWFRNDVLLEDNHQINGAKSDILNVNFLTQSDMDSKYRVEVIGQCGDVIKSEVVSIIALPEPSIVVIDTNFCTDSDILIPMSSVIDLPIGINLRIDVVTSENYEQVDINQQQYLKLKYENNSSDLKQIILKYVHPSTNYLVGEVTYKFYVLTTPVIAKDLPAQIAVKEGDRLELGSYCFIQPSIFSDWYLNDVLYTQAWNSSLIWDKVSTKNQGLWKVRYYNTCGEVWSKECEVTITPKSEVTAVAGNKFANEIIVSPNPASEFLSVNLQSTFDTFVIFDILGNKLIESNIDPSLKTLTIDLNVNNIQSGSYFIIFRKAGEIRTVKFSVIK